MILTLLLLLLISTLGIFTISTSNSYELSLKTNDQTFYSNTPTVVLQSSMGYYLQTFIEALPVVEKGINNIDLSDLNLDKTITSLLHKANTYIDYSREVIASTVDNKLSPVKLNCTADNPLNPVKFNCTADNVFHRVKMKKLAYDMLISNSNTSTLINNIVLPKIVFNDFYSLTSSFTSLTELYFTFYKSFNSVPPLLYYVILFV